ncbi:hypothetical protein ACFQ9X_28355 [Catenulispora yoronensis]
MPASCRGVRDGAGRRGGRRPAASQVTESCAGRRRPRLRRRPGSAVTHDGRSKGPTEAGAQAHTEVSRQVSATAGVAANRVRYVESGTTGGVARLAKLALALHRRGAPGPWPEGRGRWSGWSTASVSAVPMCRWCWRRCPVPRSTPSRRRLSGR